MKKIICAILGHDWVDLSLKIICIRCKEWGQGYFMEKEHFKNLGNTLKKVNEDMKKYGSINL